MRAHLLVLACAGAVAAQTPTANGAGFGALYRDVALDPATGAALHLGVAVDPADGHVFVSASGAAGPPHQIHEFDPVGNYVGAFAQPAVHNATSFGLRDLDSDGHSLIGGSEAGISVFSRQGALVNQLVSSRGPQAIVQPIAGAALAALGTVRALAFDPNGNNGNGSLLVGNFSAAIVECDLNGAILQTWPNTAGWSAYGLAVDPVTGNAWVNALGQDLRVAELDRSTMLPTGNGFAQVEPGAAPGGLSLASLTAGHHEPWSCTAAFAHVSQAVPDRLAINRVHLWPNVVGFAEPTLRIGTNGSSPVAGNVPFRAGDTLDLLVIAPGGVGNGAPVWTIIDFYLDASRDAYTNFSALFPGAGILVEHRTLNAISSPASTTFALVGHLMGTPLSFAMPPGFPVLQGDLLRAQSLYLQPASPQFFGSTNEANWLGVAGERGIVVAAAGPTSFNAGANGAFWTVASDLTHAHGAITSIEISFVGAAAPAGLLRFDIDQTGMADRFDGGNSVMPGCRGTYRAGSDQLCGLDYQAPGVWRLALCHSGPNESCGASFSSPPTVMGEVADLRFAFSAFTPGKTFAFDCDTDGGPPSGDMHAGTIVRVATANSGLLQGVLQVDPARFDRGVVWFP
jgi:hypothetical protein